MATTIQAALQRAQANQWQGSSKSHKATNDLGRSTVAKLFVRLQTIYGHKWLSVVPDEMTSQVAMAEWRHQLAGLTPAELERGFERLSRRRDSTWPPSVLEFRALCRPHREPYQREEFQGHALPLKPASQAFAREQMAKARAALAGGSHENKTSGGS